MGHQSQQPTTIPVQHSGGQRPQQAPPMQSHQQATTGHRPITGQSAAVEHQSTPGGRVGIRFEDHLSNEVLTVLQDFQRLESLSAWCAEQCLEMGGQFARAANTCHDVSDFAHLGVQFMSRNPDRQVEVGEFILGYLQDARQTLTGYQSEPMWQLVEALDRATTSLQQALTPDQRQQRLTGQPSARAGTRQSQQQPMATEDQHSAQQPPTRAGRAQL